MNVPRAFSDRLLRQSVPAVFLRRFAVFRLEAAGKIELIAETVALADLENRQIAFQEQTLSFEHDTLVDVAADRDTDLVLEFFRQCTL